jgi:hypothetical protein
MVLLYQSLENMQIVLVSQLRNVSGAHGGLHGTARLDAVEAVPEAASGDGVEKIPVMTAQILRGEARQGELPESRSIGNPSSLG